MVLGALGMIKKGSEKLVSEIHIEAGTWFSSSHEATDKDASGVQKADAQGREASVNKVDVKVNKGSEVKS